MIQSIKNWWAGLQAVEPIQTATEAPAMTSTSVHTVAPSVTHRDTQTVPQQQTPSSPKKQSSAVGKVTEGDIIYLRNGKSTQLGAEFASGGEGRLYKLPSVRGAVAKIYKPKLFKTEGARTEFEQRIQVMSHNKELKGSRDMGWPHYPLYDAHQNFVGFGMAFCQGLPLQTLLSREDLNRQFPDWTRIEQAELAVNLLRNIACLHGKGFIVGDLNPNNVLFCPHTRRTMLIDCDSYQFRNGQKWFLNVGYVDLYSAPEVNKNPEALHTTPRTFHSENWSIATLLFMLFMFGIHPFAHRGGQDGVSAMQQGVTFPWMEAGLKNTPMGPWNGYWYSLPPFIQAMFTKAFAHPFSPSSRPDASAWFTAIEQYRRDLAQNRCRVLIPVYPKNGTR